MPNFIFSSKLESSFRFHMCAQAAMTFCRLWSTCCFHLFTGTGLEHYSPAVTIELILQPQQKALEWNQTDIRDKAALNQLSRKGFSSLVAPGLRFVHFRVGDWGSLLCAGVPHSATAAAGRWESQQINNLLSAAQERRLQWIFSLGAG